MENTLMDILVRDFFGDDNGFASAKRIHYPVDIYEEKEKMVFKIVALQAIKKDIQIETKEGDILKVIYTKNEEKDNSDKKYHVKNIVNRSCNFEWKIPSKFDASKSEAELKNGVLTIEIPIKPESKPKQIALK